MGERVALSPEKFLLMGLLNSVETCLSMHLTISGPFLLKSTRQVPTVLHHMSCPGFLSDLAVVFSLHDPIAVLRQKDRANTAQCLGSSLLTP